MIDEKDFILKPRKTPGHFKKKFRGTCDNCGCDRGYVDKSRANLLCRSCSRAEVHKNMAPTMKQKISAATSKQFTGHTPWNKGKVGIYSEVLRQQWSQKHKELMTFKENRINAGSGRRNSWLKGKSLPHDIKVKISCAQRNIPIDQFDDFRHLEKDQDRHRFQVLGLSKQCFTRDDYTCQVCDAKGIHLHAHHKNSFDKFPDQRFDLDNLATVCKDCHEKFHIIYGKGNNTEQQFIEFKMGML